MCSACQSLLFKPDSAGLHLIAIQLGGIYPRLRVSAQAWCVVRRLPALERKAPELKVTPARQAAFGTRWKLFLPVPQEAVGWLDLNHKKSLSSSSLEVITPWVLVDGWGFLKANSGLISEHRVLVPGRGTDLLWAGVCWVNQVALNSPCCLWDHNFL